MASNMKPCIISHEQKLWIHNSIMHILDDCMVVSAHSQQLFYTGKMWLILWLWKQILAKHWCPVLSILKIFDDYL
jgi:hypothetical protein